MVFEIILLSVIAGLIRGGSFRKFKSLNKKGAWALSIGLLLQLILEIGNNYMGNDIVDSLLTYTTEILILSFILIAIGILTNYKFKALWLSLIGFIMNFIAIATHGFRRPILLEGLPLIGQSDMIEIIRESAASLFTPLAEDYWASKLGNIIVFADPYPLPKIISLGDIIICIGMFLFIQEVMLQKRTFMSKY